MGLLQRVVGILLGLVFLVAVLVFASLALGILVAVGLVIWGWLWWRSRRIGTHRSRYPTEYHGGRVIEGEFRDLTRDRNDERD